LKFHLCGIIQNEVKMNALIHLYSTFLIPNKSTLAQNECTSTGQNISHGFNDSEFKTGYGITLFSYGLNERFENVNFAVNCGRSSSIPAYRKFKKVNLLNFGLNFIAFSPLKSKKNADTCSNQPIFNCQFNSFLWIILLFQTTFGRL